MAFKAPTLNLHYNLWRAWDTTQPAPALIPPDFKEQLCALWVSWKIMTFGGYVGGPNHYSALILPPKADVRPAHPGILADVVEVPAFTLRFYQIHAVDDAHKGYDNEYRIAGMQALVNVPGYWPFPTP